MPDGATTIRYFLRIVLLALAIGGLVPLLTISTGLDKKWSAVITLAICVLTLLAVHGNLFNTVDPDQCKACSGFTAPLDSSLGTAITIFLEVELLVVTAAILTVYCNNAGGSQEMCILMTGLLGLFSVGVVVYYGKVLQCPECDGRRYELFGFTMASTRQHIK